MKKISRRRFVDDSIRIALVTPLVHLTPLDAFAQTTAAAKIGPLSGDLAPGRCHHPRPADAGGSASARCATSIRVAAAADAAHSLWLASCDASIPSPPYVAFELLARTQTVSGSPVRKTDLHRFFPAARLVYECTTASRLRRLIVYDSARPASDGRRQRFDERRLRGSATESVATAESGRSRRRAASRRLLGSVRGFRRLLTWRRATQGASVLCLEHRCLAPGITLERHDFEARPARRLHVIPKDAAREDYRTRPTDPRIVCDGGGSTGLEGPFRVHPSDFAVRRAPASPPDLPILHRSGSSTRERPMIGVSGLAGDPRPPRPPPDATASLGRSCCWRWFVASKTGGVWPSETAFSRRLRRPFRLRQRALQLRCPPAKHPPMRLLARA